MAEITELAKELFEGKETRIFGTIADPLFVADDIGKILGIKTIRTTINEYEEDEKSLATVNMSGGSRQMLLLTESGLYRVLFASRKPEAKKRPAQRKEGRKEDAQYRHKAFIEE